MSARQASVVIMFLTLVGLAYALGAGIKGAGNAQSAGEFTQEERLEALSLADSVFAADTSEAEPFGGYDCGQ